MVKRKQREKMLRKMGGNKQIALIVVLILSVFSQQHLFIQDTSEQLKLSQNSYNLYFMSGNSTVVENNTSNDPTDESNSATNETSLNHSLGEDISIGCHYIPRGNFQRMLHMHIGMCEITHTSSHNFTFIADTTAIRPTLGTNDTSGIFVWTHLHPEDPAQPQRIRSFGTERTQEVRIYSNLNENRSYDVDLTFSFEFEDENSTIVNKTATLQVFDLGVECEPENLNNSTANNSGSRIHSEINCTFFRVDELRNETIFINLQVRPSFHLENSTLNLTGMEKKSVQLYAMNSTPEDLAENYSAAKIYFEAYLIRNNSTIQLSSYNYWVDMSAYFWLSMSGIQMNDDWDLNLSGVNCSDAAVHLGAMAFVCLFEGTALDEGNQTNMITPEIERSIDDEEASLPGFRAINTIMIISMASLIQLYKRKK